MVSLSRRAKSMRKVLGSTTTNCSAFSRLPAAIWVLAKPPIETARSSDHFTSIAVTGLPLWWVASRSLKVQLMPSLAICQLSASSGSSASIWMVPPPSLGSGMVLKRIKAVVAVECHAVDGLGGSDALQVEAVGAVFLDEQERFGA